MSTFIKIPGVNPPSTRPRVDLVDGMLPERGGLALLEPNHPSQQWASALTDGALIPNLAAESLQAATGRTGTQVSSAKLTVRDLDAAKFVVKRSARGGVHAARLAAQPAGSRGFAVHYPSAVLQHVISNPTHSYYGSLWMRVTANTDGTHAWQLLSASTTLSEKLGYTHIISNANTNYPNTSAEGATRLGLLRKPNVTRSYATYVSEPVPYPFFGSVGVDRYAGEITLAADAATEQSRAFNVGAINPYGMQYPDVIAATFYRAYFEDLTLSGRSYADVEALDYAEYTKQVMTSGGRYYNDSVTV